MIAIIIKRSYFKGGPIIEMVFAKRYVFVNLKFLPFFSFSFQFQLFAIMQSLFYSTLVSELN